MRLLKALFSSPPAMEPTSAQAAIAAGARVIDVREPAEFVRGAIPGAVNVPLGRLTAQAENALRDAGVAGDAATLVIFVCQSGMRSRLACNAVAPVLGDRAVNLTGGMARWASQGLAVAGTSGS